MDAFSIFTNDKVPYNICIRLFALQILAFSQVARHLNCYKTNMILESLCISISSFPNNEELYEFCFLPIGKLPELSYVGIKSQYKIP